MDLVRLLAFRTTSLPVRYGGVVVAVLLAALVRAALPVLGLPFLLFVPALMLAAFALGRGPGLLGVALSAFIAAYVFIEPAFSFTLSMQNWLAVVLFGAVGFGIVAVSSSLAESMLQRDADLVRLAEKRSVIAASEAFLQSVLSSSNDCIKVLDLDARLLSMNAGGLAVMEISDFNDVRGCPWPDFWKEIANADAVAALEAAKRGQMGRFQGMADTFKGNPRWWDVVVTPIRGAGGQPEKLLSVSRDMTELKQAQEQTRLLGLELQHRVKNSLAMVQAIVRQTLRNAPSVKAAQDTIEARLAAMGRSHDLLTRDGWASAGLHAVIESALDIHADGAPEQFTIAGPTVTLSPEAAMSFALLLHELATNATKYGALSVPGGHVAIAWSVGPASGGGTRLDFAWRESGGPPVTEPERRGFGSRLIERGLATSLRGTAVLHFLNEGVVCDVSGIVEPAAGQPTA